MNVIFTCGGTGGHINPAIAVANLIRERHPDSKILFIGAKGHMEEQLVPKAGYELKCLKISGMFREKTLNGIKKNLCNVSDTIRAVAQTKKIIREFQPDVIFGTGGYACFPALMAGSSMKIPTAIHESNAIPGLTTKLVADRVDRVMIAFPESAKHYKKQVDMVGMPVRREFIYKTREEARKELGIGDEPLVVSAFGSLGAKKMNEMVAELFALEQENGFAFRHIHATGSYGWEWMPKAVAEKGVDLSKASNIEMKEYIYNMPTVMAAADVIISRAGAGSCNEIAASGTPGILIPSPNVAANHQEKNARVLADRGGAVLILEKDCSAKLLYDTISDLLADQKKMDAMSTALRSWVMLDSAEKICDLLEQLAKTKTRDC